MSRLTPLLFSTTLKPAVPLLCAALAACQSMQPLTIPLPAQEKETLHVPSREFFLFPGERMVGSLYNIRTRERDTLSDIARHFALGYNEIVSANPSLDPWMPIPGSRVLLPMQHILPDASHEGMILNLPTMRLFFFPKRQQPATLYTYPIGVGREGWETPTGKSRIVDKKTNPAWTVPPSIRREHAEKGDPLPKVVPPGPDNPLGAYAMRLSIPGYLIHGTNKPYGVGLRVSHGCIRLYPEDIEVLFGKTAVGASVTIVNQPYLTAWHSGDLYLEAHQPLEQNPRRTASLRKALIAQLGREAKKANATIDWARVDRILERADGIPAPVLAQSPDIQILVQAAPAVAHPGHFYGQPEVGELSDDKWAIAVASFANESEARRLAAMLSHQGPPIPARPLRKNRFYHVIAGPFKNEGEALSAADRIRREFQFDAEPLTPGAVWKN